jgi:metal-responsive CopG/Arc/MetJ family transcriptional regulator
MKIKIKREGLTSVQLRPEISKKMVFFLKMGISKSELINEALRQYLVEREIQELRSRMIPLAQAKGIYTDDDVERFLNR